MTNSDEINERLFNQSGCLKLEALKKHSFSELSEKEKYLVESHLKNCELCSDALEGLKLVSDKEKLSSIITEINDNLQKSILSKESFLKAKSFKMSDRILYFSLAASVLILIGLFSYFKYYLEKPESDITVLTDKPKEEVNIQTPQNFKENNLEITTEEKIAKPDPNNFNQDKQETADTKINIEPEKEEYKPEGLTTEIADDFMPTGEIEPEVIMFAGKSTQDTLIDIVSVNQPIEYFIGGVVVSEENKSKDRVYGIVLKQSSSREKGSKRTEKKSANSETNAPMSSGNGISAQKDANIEDEYLSPSILELEEEVDEQDVIFTLVELMPEFPGGNEEFFRYLHKNLNYPKEASDSAIQGRVYISFVVEEDGRISNAKVIRGIGGGCDEEAVRVIEQMPEWTPGYQRGKSIKVQYNMPIIFKLN